MELAAVNSGVYTVIAVGLGFFGTCLYGLIAWFFKRLISMLDELTKVTQELHSKVSNIDTRLHFVENKIGVMIPHDND